MRFLHDAPCMIGSNVGEQRMELDSKTVAALVILTNLTMARTVESWIGVPNFLAALSKAPW